ncbi:MAG: hypothetical protein M1816_005504 [Peltula sp. TS41687]|nr:MAG: hypothetical protein M1816_005504 [Peltula sp. TS41687]
MSSKADEAPFKPSSRPPTSTDKTLHPNPETEEEEQAEDLRFPPDEEATLLAESSSLKLRANSLFSGARYSEAIQQYERALSACPTYMEYEVAVLQSNIAACHIKLADWSSAVEAATKALEALDRLQRKDSAGEKEKEKEGGKTGVEDVDEEEEVEDIISPGASRIGPLEKKKTTTTTTAAEEERQRREERARIRIKVLLRRAKARGEMGGWSALAGAEEDYTSLATMTGSLSAPDRKVVMQQLKDLPGRIEEAKKKEMGDMMGKLKELGNGILKPFGLSTDNFNMVKDEKSGGYSVQFNQGGSS